VPSLEKLIASAHEVLAVITQPDRPGGRGRQMLITPVKEVALAHGIPVLQPEGISGADSFDLLRSYGPIGAMVVVAYGQKITPELLNWPQHGVVNVHGSILPKYRGAAPIQHAIISGERETGVTTMLMDEGWDTGDILLQQTLDILPDENAGELSVRLS
jgi:methionyl-tRNA formyltransferase